ncbi:hypothetical protein [Flavobacterium pallidum]|uniref:Uncharacterized protein n=1 Tax=Flavobacterium pallidum TaxID=2172098 RepID=A0A2S1SDT8_9FLAO|nr:hypothetical protein [Flavobacterium pallidum]AWI24534.1 hypothetical protein HYN49_00740 [Flavobacterium pallidum]
MKVTKLLLALFTAVALTSCNFTEEIYVNNDGGGKFSIQLDGSQLAAMAGKEMQNDPQAGKVIDSTFSFKELFAAKEDSIAKLPTDEQERLRKLENYTVSMKMNAAEQQMLFTMATDFKNIGELEDAWSAMSGMSALDKGMGKTNPMAQAGGIGNNNSLLKYSYDGKKFSRKATLLKKETAETENDSLGEAFNMIYESSTYTVKYHFPKKVKKVSNASAMLSSDKKTVTVEYPFMDYMKEPEKLNFDVEFEK